MSFFHFPFLRNGMVYNFGCVCLSVCHLSFESLDVGSSYFHIWYIRSSSYMMSSGQGQGYSSQKGRKCLFTLINFCWQFSSVWFHWFDRVWSVPGLLWSAVCPSWYGGWFDRVWSLPGLLWSVVCPSWYGGWFDRVWSLLGLLWSAVCPSWYGGWFDRVWSVLGLLWSAICPSWYGVGLIVCGLC